MKTISNNNHRLDKCKGVHRDALWFVRMTFKGSQHHTDPKFANANIQCLVTLLC